MKKFNTIFASAFILFQIVHCTLNIENCEAQSGWYWQYPQPTGNNLRSVVFTDANTCWMTGYYGTILKSTNAGENWFAQASNSIMNLGRASFINNSTGWTAGNANYNGEILKTTNGGDNWVTISNTTENYYYNIFFVSEYTGWCLHYDINTWELTPIMKSTNGGYNWTEQWTENDPLIFLTSIFFPSASTGFAIGGKYDSSYSNLSAFILKTSDGGQTWMSQIGDTNTLLRSLYFISPNVGWAVGSTRLTDNGVIMKTVNGGTSWSRQIIQGAPLRTVFFSTPEQGWVAGNNGKIYTTGNGGNNWNLQQSGTITELYSINFSGVNSGIAAGDFGTVVRTTNSGVTWITYPKKDSMNYNSICFSSGETGWAVGSINSSQPGAITKTTDGGDTWTRYPVTFSKALNFVKEFNSIVWAVGVDGIIVKSTNYGNSWIPNSSLITSSLYSIYFVNASTGWAVGNLVSKTTNGGASWFPQNSGTYNTMRSVWFTSETNGIAVGDGGTIIKTSNAGENWNVIPGVSTGYLTNVCFTDSENGWIAGDSYLLRSTNGGSNWITQPAVTNPYYIYFFTPMIGYTLGFNGAGTEIKKTTNGGQTWEDQHCPAQYNIYSVCFASALTGCAVGYSGTILRTTTGGAPIGIMTNSIEIPNHFLLSQNFPNPFNPSTIINYQLSMFNYVSLKVFDVLGKEVATLVSEKQSAGTYQVEFDGSNLTSGVYFYKLTAGEFTDTKKMVLIK